MRKYVSKNYNLDANVFVGSPGTLTVEPGTNELRIHDGSTPGGSAITGGGGGGLGPTGPAGTPGSGGSAGAPGADGQDGATGPAGTNGATGPAGTNGTNGTNGATGPAGTNGSNGATGPAGTNGTNGTNGATGPAGTNGSNGATGPAGTNGTNGTNGSTGATGPAGTNGSNGATGPAGTNGTNGATGPAGADGVTGPAGVDGVTGPAGADSTVTGPTGADGSTGAAGTSVKIVDSVSDGQALAGYNTSGLHVGDGIIQSDTGNLQVWTGSVFDDVGQIKGPQGNTGPAGADGTTGPAGADSTVTGPAGIDGTTGPAGIDGVTGPAGIDGTTGPAGADGVTGPAGIDGTTGPAGIDGLTGPAGADGVTGPAGIDGTTGPAGADGTTGPAGTDGVTGPAGIDGTTGPAGADSTVTGPAGIDGPTGADSTVTGPTGAASTVTGPTGVQQRFILISDDYTAEFGDRILADTSANPWTLTLPSSPDSGDIVTVADYAGTWGINNLTINASGNKINGLTDDLVCNVNDIVFDLMYLDPSIGWQVVTSRIQAGNIGPTGAASTVTGPTGVQQHFILISDDYTAEFGDRILANTSVKPWTLTLPSSPDSGDIVTIADYAGTWGVNNLTVNAAGNKISSLTDDLVCDVGDIVIDLMYLDPSIGWQVVTSRIQAGNTGPIGDVGPTGAAGTSVKIVGNVTDEGSLPNPYGGSIGDGYLITSGFKIGHLYVWGGSSWTDVGKIQGPAGADGVTGPAGADGATGPAGSGSGSIGNFIFDTTNEGVDYQEITVPYGDNIYVTASIVNINSNGNAGLLAESIDGNGNVYLYTADPSFDSDTGIPVYQGFGGVWKFDRDGKTTFPQGSSFGSPGAGEFSLFNPIDTDFAIYTDDGTTHSWLFGTDGNLTLPNNTTIGDNLVEQYTSSFTTRGFGWSGGVHGNFSSDVAARGFFANALIDTLTAGWYVSGPGLIGVKEITQIIDVGNSHDYELYVDLTDGSDWISTVDPYTFYTPDYSLASQGTNLTVNGNTWTFGNDGTLTFPDTSEQTTAWRGLVNAGDQTLGGRLYLNGKKLADGPYEANKIEMGVSLGLSAVRGIGGPSGGIVLQTGEGYTAEHNWQFGYDGNITLPNTNKIAMHPDTAQVGQFYRFLTDSNGVSDPWDNVATVVLNKPLGFTTATWPSLGLADGGVYVNISSVVDNLDGTITVSLTSSSSGTAYPLLLASSDYSPAVADGGTEIVTDTGSWLFRNDGVLSTGNISIHGHIIPTEDNTFDLGSPDREFRHVYTANGSIYLGNVKLSNDGGVLAVYSVDNRGENTETNTAVALKTDRIVNGEFDVHLQSDGSMVLPVGSNLNVQQGAIVSANESSAIQLDVQDDADMLNGIRVSTGGAAPIQIVTGINIGGGNAWTFGTAGNLTVPGTITFSDGTVQRTAYDYAPMNLVNLDGGFATTQFDLSYVYVDCGGSKKRGVLAEDTFDGDVNGATTTVFTKTLNGGGA